MHVHGGKVGILQPTFSFATTKVKSLISFQYNTWCSFYHPITRASPNCLKNWPRPMGGDCWCIFHPGKLKHRGANLSNLYSDRTERAEVAGREPSFGLDENHIFLCPVMRRCSQPSTYGLLGPSTLKGLGPVHGKGCLIQHLSKDRSSETCSRHEDVIIKESKYDPLLLQFVPFYFFQSLAMAWR